MKYKLRFIHRFSGLAALCAATAAHAQTNPAPAATETNVNSKVVVTAVPIEEQVLPTARPVESVMGDSRSIIETPRSVSLVTKAQMTERGISRATEFNQFAPGVYTPARYGLANVPVIRGDLSEIYQNGQRMLYSRNSSLASFNGVEAMDIVKGPGSAVYGPQGQGPGGYVNFVTKTPYQDSFHGELTTKWGDLESDSHSHFDPEWTLDFGGPINDKLAYRVSYLGREGDGYYQNTKNNTQDIFVALAWHPNDKLSVDFNTEFYTSRFNEVIGINRVTQDLIDNGIYISGPVSNPANPYFAVIDASKAKRVKISPYQTINNPRDGDLAKKFTSQLIATYTIDDNTKLVNRTYGETQDSAKRGSYGYTEYVPTNWEINNRSEFDYAFTPKIGNYELPITTITGIDERYSRLISYQDFSSEPFQIWDVTQPATSFNFQKLVGSSTIGGAGLSAPGHPDLGYQGFGAGDQDSKLWQNGLFTQWDTKVHEKFNIIAGGRGDYDWAYARSPITYNTTTGKINAPGTDYSVDANSLDGSVFISGIYKIAPTWSTYVTYDLVSSVQGSSNYGGVDGTSNTKDGLRRSLATISELIEWGTKASFFDNTFYVAGDIYQQVRVGPQSIGPAIGIVNKGVELEAVYQPNRNFTANGNFTLQNSKQNDQTYQQTYSYTDGYPVGYIIDSTGAVGTGIGSPNYNTAAGRSRPAGTITSAGVPPWLFNAYVSYKFDNGFGVGFGSEVQAKQLANQEGSLKIPLQYTLNANIFYRQKRWEVQLNMYNLTDERNWTSIDPGFAGNDIIFPEQPFHLNGTVKIRF